MAWVEANHPDAIETKVIAAVPEQTIPAVPEQTLKSVSGRRMAELEKHFDLTDQGVVDTTTGTIVDGMVVVPAAAPKSFEVRYETGGAGGRTDLALAYRAGKLNHVVAGTATLPAIEAKPVVERRLASVPMDYDGSHGRLNGPGEPFTVVGETVANVEDDLGQCGMPGCVGCAGCDPDGDYSRFEGDGDQEWRANPTPVQDQVDADLAQEFGGHRRGEWDDARAKAVVEAFGTDPVPADDFDPGDWDAAPSQTAQGW